MSDIHALVPAAGFGQRMGNNLPKQYLPLAGRPMIAHSLRILCANSDISTVFIVLAPDDTIFNSYDWSGFGGKLQPLFCGGEVRSQTVLNGLQASEIEPDDWVLVHDAARPCLTQELLAKLIAELRQDDVGGILAIPVADTIKRADQHGRIMKTENRDRLWHAQTPQMFRAGLLTQALFQPGVFTDDASAVEMMGLHPKLVLSEPTNFKVTYPRDLMLAELFITKQGK